MQKNKAEIIVLLDIRAYYKVITNNVHTSNKVTATKDVL